MFVKNDEEFIKLMDENPDLLDLWYFKGKTAYYYNQVRYDKLKKIMDRDKKIDIILNEKATL
jgi:hypothetical protein